MFYNESVTGYSEFPIIMKNFQISPWDSTVTLCSSLELAGGGGGGEGQGEGH